MDAKNDSKKPQPKQQQQQSAPPVISSQQSFGTTYMPLNHFGISRDSEGHKVFNFSVSLPQDPQCSCEDSPKKPQ